METAPGPRIKEADIPQFETFVTKVILFVLIVVALGLLARLLQWAF
jgi:hypothetical protein